MRRIPRISNGRGLTLVEVLVATGIIALLVGATTSASRIILATERATDEAIVVSELGIALLEEIAALPWDDPHNPTATLGPEFGEWIPLGNRANFDDVDDYTVWNGSAGLEQKDGTTIPLPGYTRRVAVTYVNSANFDLSSVSATDFKKIAVAVYKDGELIRTFSTVRVQGGRRVDFDG